MLGKYSTISNRRPATTHICAMRTYFSSWQTSTANVTNETKPFLRKPAHPLRLNIGTLQNLPSCFHTSRFKTITSIHCQRPLQKRVNNHIDNVDGVTFNTRKHMSPQGPIFCGWLWNSYLVIIVWLNNVIIIVFQLLNGKRRHSLKLACQKNDMQGYRSL